LALTRTIAAADLALVVKMNLLRREWRRMEVRVREPGHDALHVGREKAGDRELSRRAEGAGS
jgi:hypothetical protein